MAHSDSEYPLHQPQGRKRREPFDAETEIDDFESEHGAGSPRRSRFQTHAPFHQRNAPYTPQLPPWRTRNTLIIGFITGIIVALQGIIVTLLNAPIYNSVKHVPQGQMTLNQLGTLVGLFCLTSFISLLFYFIAGFITGKVAVDRRLGFLAGFLAGIVASVINYLIHQVPQYPDATTPGFNGGAGGIVSGFLGALVLLAVTALVAAAVSYLGARIAQSRILYRLRRVS